MRIGEILSSFVMSSQQQQTSRDGTCHSVLQTRVDLGPNNNVYRFIENHGQKSILFYEEGKLHPSEF